MLPRTISSRFAFTVLPIILIILLAGCVATTPQPTPTSPPPTDTPVPTATDTPEPTSTPTYTPTRTKTPTLKPTNTPSATSPPTLPPSPRVTNAPRPTPTPTQPPAPPLLTAVQGTQNHVYAMGGAMDRIYNEGNPEACAPFLDDFFSVIDAPEYDVSGQPSNVQGAYGLYRQAIAIVDDQLGKIATICLTGGGVIGPLDFDLARIAVNDAGSLLGQAIGLLPKH